LINQADQYLANSFSLTKENIEELIDDLVDGSYTEQDFEEDLDIAASAASKLYENIREEVIIKVRFTKNSKNFKIYI